MGIGAHSPGAFGREFRQFRNELSTLVKQLFGPVAPHPIFENLQMLRLVREIGDRTYGLRDFTIADPDGFGIRFASWLGPPSE